MYSVAISGKLYWAKAFRSINYETIRGVQFSADGTLLIGHSARYNSFIVVFEVSTGSIKSARTYSTGGNWNYNFNIKSMLLSSEASPMAYVLSDYNDGTCKGQHFFKLDPLKFSNSLIWIKKTIGNDILNCGHLGLTFGRS